MCVFHEGAHTNADRDAENIGMLDELQLGYRPAEVGYGTKSTLLRFAGLEDS
jgi:hypothetical protein